MVAKIASYDDQGFHETEKRSLRVVLAFTSVSKDESSRVVDDDEEAAGTEDNDGIFSTNYGRFVFGREIERGSKIFCQKAPYPRLVDTRSQVLRRPLGGEHW
jgi:hypothetical protein